MNTSRTAVLTAAAAVAATVLTGPVPAFAKGGSGDVRSSTGCSTGVLKLKAKHDDGRIEVEAEVDTNRNGQVWTIRLQDNGVTVFNGRGTTRAPSGSFSVGRLVPDRAGVDTVTVRVTRGATACGTTVRL